MRSAAQVESPRPMVGRDGEAELLAGAVAAGRSVLVVGPGGMGKTTLVEEVLASLDRPAVAGAGLEFLGSEAYGALVPVLGRPPAAGDVAAVVDEVRRSVPPGSVLVLDDLQWADEHTLGAIDELIRSGPLVGCVRPGTARASELIRQWGEVGDVVHLAPLELDHATALTARWLPGADRDLAASVARRCGGLPLALRAMARSWPVDDPAEIEPLRAVLAAWSPAMVLAMAEVHLGLVSSVGCPTGVVDLVDAGWVVERRGHLRPMSDVLGELAVLEIPPEVAQQLHRDAAHTSVLASVAARHWRAAGDLEVACQVARTAAAAECTLVGRAELLTLAMECSTGPMRAELAIEAGRALLRAGGSYETVLGWAETLDGQVPDAIDVQIACLRARQALDRSGPAQAEPMLVEALARCARHDDDPALLEAEYYVRTLLAACAINRFAFSEAHEQLDHGLEVAGRIGRRTDHVETMRLLVRAQQGDLTATRDMRALLGCAASGEEPHAAFEAGILLSHHAILSGRADDGYALLDGLATYASGLNHRAWCDEVAAIVGVHRCIQAPGDDEVVARLGHLRFAATSAEARRHVGAVEAIAIAWSGDFERSRVVLGQVAEGDPSTVAEDMVAVAAAEIAWLEGSVTVPIDVDASFRPEIAMSAPWRAVLSRWASVEGGGDPRTTRGPAVFFPALLGLNAESNAIVELASPGRELVAADLFDGAASLHAPYLARSALRCRWAAGEAARRGGSVERAVDALVDLRGDCLSAGQLGLLGRIDRSLRACGVALPNEERVACGAGLTRRQREVMGLVAEGLSTPEISKRLGISERTVNAHVEACLRRLHVSTRAEAVSRLAARTS